MDSSLYLAAACAAVAIVFALVKFSAIIKKDAGDSTMQDIARQVQEGAAAFLKTEYKWLAVFVVIVGGLIALSDAENGLGGKTAIAFVAGACAS
jgi:K(+)-stimulated pyrophosphate-energized sodium pump